MRPWLLPARRSAATVADRAVEASPAQIALTGAAAGSGYGGDVIDPGERGWRRLGSGVREVPWWTLERARMHSVAGYRSNPMLRAIVDTYTSFCVGDSGVTPDVTNPKVAEVVDEFWRDPRNALIGGQELGLRSLMLLGETLRELMTGRLSGVVRWAPLDPISIQDIGCAHGNPQWPELVEFGPDRRVLTIAGVDDATRLRDGEALFWAPWRATESDVRSMPFLAPVIDAIDGYDQITSNLIDRTALARYMVWHVTLEGASPEQIQNWIATRGGLHAPRSGAVEVTNDKVKWEPKTADTGAYEDAHAGKTILTQVASGAGLAKTWLAEPEDANRATSLTMAEPVRRRVGGVQKVWLDCQTELVRFAVDRAVAARRLPATVEATDPRTGDKRQVPAALCASVTGPEIAAADAQLAATVLLNLATALEKLVDAGAMTPEAAEVAARKGWEDFMGIPYSSDLGKPTGRRSGPRADRDDIATHIDTSPTNDKAPLRAV